jgi:2',3'-cyclic-nucleotide 2'-phosphodiesterase (5'-nucleotidase family)
LGRLDLQFNKDDRGEWCVGDYSECLVPVTAEYPEDSAVAAVVARYWEPIAARYGEVIGQAAADFVELPDDKANYDLVADAVRETYGTDVELENLGGIRAPLIQGNITLADLIALDPFDNTVVIFKITGRRLKEVLVRSRPAVSGLRYRIEAGQLAEATIGGKPVEDERVYTAASNSYLAETALKGIQISDTGKQRLQVVIDYIRKKGTVHPTHDGRRVILD